MNKKLDITTIMQISTSQVLLEIGRGDLVFGAVSKIGETAYVCILTHLPTKITVPICWTDADDNANPTEEDKIDMVNLMISNAINSIDVLLNNSTDMSLEEDAK